MKIYNYASGGDFVGESFADKSPIDIGEVWLIPANATTIAPPEVPGGKRAVFVGGAWQLLDVATPESPVQEEPNETPEQTRIRLKAAREASVSAIKVTTTAGHEFDGDETSQTRMARAIVAMNDIDETLWVLADNTPIMVGKEELREALRMAGEAQTAIWLIP